MDLDKSGYLDENEFINALKNVNYGLSQELDLKKQKRIFKSLAIRRIKKRYKIFFYDFYKSVFAINSLLYETDITRMNYPIHGIINENY